MASGRTPTGIAYPLGGVDEFNPAADMQELAESAALGAYPVGSIYMSINPTDPGELFGGRWQAYAAGRVLVGRAPGDPLFGTVNQAGGSRDQRLVALLGHAGGNVNSLAFMASPLGAAPSSGAHAYSINRTQTNAVLSTATGGTRVMRVDDGQEASTVQPYIVCHMWVRTA